MASFSFGHARPPATPCFGQVSFDQLGAAGGGPVSFGLASGCPGAVPPPPAALRGSGAPPAVDGAGTSAGPHGPRDLEALSVEELRGLLADREVAVEQLRARLAALKHEPHKWEVRVRRLEDQLAARGPGGARPASGAAPAGQDLLPPAVQNLPGAKTLRAMRNKLRKMRGRMAAERGQRSEDSDPDDDSSSSGSEDAQPPVPAGERPGPPGFALGRGFMPLDLFPPPRFHYTGHMARELEVVPAIRVSSDGVARREFEPPAHRAGFWLDHRLAEKRTLPPEDWSPDSDGRAGPGGEPDEPGGDGWASSLRRRLREDVGEIMKDWAGEHEQANSLAPDVVPPEVFSQDRPGVGEDRLEHDWKGEEMRWRKHYLESLMLTR